MLPEERAELIRRKQESKAKEATEEVKPTLPVKPRRTRGSNK